MQVNNFPNTYCFILHFQSNPLASFFHCYLFLSLAVLSSDFVFFIFFHPFLDLACHNTVAIQLHLFYWDIFNNFHIEHITQLE